MTCKKHGSLFVFWDLILSRKIRQLINHKSLRKSLKIRCFLAPWKQNILYIKDMFMINYHNIKVANMAIIRPSQIACTITTMHLTCTQTALRGHEKSCTVVIPLFKNNLNLPVSHADHYYAIRK